MQENNTPEQILEFFKLIKHKPMENAKKIFLQHPKILASIQFLTPKDIEEIEALEAKFSNLSLEDAKEWISYGAEILSDIISKNNIFFLNLTKKSKFFFNLIKEKMGSDIEKTIKEFSKNLSIIISQCQDDRISMNRDDPFDCFTAYLRLSNANVNPLEQYLKTNPTLFILLLEHITSLYPILQAYSQTSTAEKSNTETQPKQILSTQEQAANYILENKYEFIANVISSIAEKTTVKIKNLYNEWFSNQTEYNKNLIENHSNKKQYFYDPLKYNLKKILFINSNIFGSVSTNISHNEELSAMEFVNIVLNLNNNNINNLITYLQINRSIFIYLQTFIAKTNDSDKTLVNRLNDKIFATEKPNYSAATASFFIKRHVNFIFNLLCSTELTPLIIFEKNIQKRQLLIDLKKRADIFHAYFNDNPFEVAIKFQTTFNTLLPEKSEDASVFMHDLTNAIIDCMLDNNQKNLKECLSSAAGQEIAEFIANEANDLDPIIAEWEEDFKDLLEEGYTAAHATLPNQPVNTAVKTKDLKAPNTSNSINNASSDEEMPSFQEKLSSNYSQAALSSQARSAMEAKNNPCKKRKAYDSHNVERYLDNLTSAIIYGDYDRPQTKIARVDTPQTNSM